ncbi:unnamed protein product [Diatraea saccharalis]|uniref:Peptidoglycan recognition protein n=1 Tax=Diatraea saccharalis TaxID=40085 RepID=A0A9N9R8G7_9NEOP|nr:unnamed protein product [Diatraea saccharalis]
MYFLLTISFLKFVGVTFAAPPLVEYPSKNEVTPYNFPFVTRSQWNARAPKQMLPLTTPVPYVVIHHSYTPGACATRPECIKAMQSMQNFHMDDRDWWDIGYNYAVGGDGAAYEGRGWDSLGAHALHFNSISIGICVIGDWRFQLPPAQQLKTVQSLIAAGVKLGRISSEYKLIGHRQVRDTECPGDALFNEIKKWDKYADYPSCRDDLLSMPEVPEKTKDVIRGNSTYDF